VKFTLFTTLLLVVMLCPGCSSSNIKSITSDLEDGEISEIEVRYHEFYYANNDSLAQDGKVEGEIKENVVIFSFNEKQLTDSLRYLFISFLDNVMFEYGDETPSQMLESQNSLYDMDSSFISLRISFDVTFRNKVIMELNTDFSKYGTYYKNEKSNYSSLIVSKPNPNFNANLLDITFHLRDMYLTDYFYVKASPVQLGIINLFSELLSLHNSNSPDSSRKITLLPPSVRIK